MLPLLPLRWAGARALRFGVSGVRHALAHPAVAGWGGPAAALSAASFNRRHMADLQSASPAAPPAGGAPGASLDGTQVSWQPRRTKRERGTFVEPPAEFEPSEPQSEPAAGEAAEGTPPLAASAEDPSTAAAEADIELGVKDGCTICGYEHLIDYKNVGLLSQFVSPITGRILPRSQTGVCALYQRRIATEIKRAREFGLMPYLRRIALPGLPNPLETASVDNRAAAAAAVAASAAASTGAASAVVGVLDVEIAARNVSRRLHRERKPASETEAATPRRRPYKASSSTDDDDDDDRYDSDSDDFERRPRSIAATDAKSGRATASRASAATATRPARQTLPPLDAKPAHSPYLLPPAFLTGIKPAQQTTERGDDASSAGAADGDKTEKKDKN